MSAWPPSRIECQAHWPEECKAAFGAWYEKFIFSWIEETEALYKQMDELEQKLYYFEETVCAPMMIHRRPNTSILQMAISSEKVAAVVRERDELKAQLKAIEMIRGTK